MRRFAALAPLLVVSLAWAVGPPPVPSPEVTKLISQLGDDDLDTRRAAMTKLQAMGEPVVLALRKVGREHEDVDVRLRAHAVAGAIENKHFGELRRFTGHTDGVVTVAVSPDGTALASGAWLGGRDHLVRLWDVKTGKNTRSLKGHTGLVVAVAYLPDGKWLLSGGGDRVMRLWDLTTGKEVRQFAHAGMPHSIAVSGDGKTAVTCCHSDAVLYLWDLEKGKLIRRVSGHVPHSRGVAWVPGQDRYLSASGDGGVRLWDLKERKVGKEKERKAWKGKEMPVARLPHGKGEREGQGAWFVAARPGGKQAVSCGQDGQLRFWDLEKRTLIRAVAAHAPSAHGVAYSPDGKRVLSCGYDNMVRLWDADTGAALQVLEGHTDRALAVAFLPDGRHAVSASYDKTLRLWKLRR